MGDIEKWQREIMLWALDQGIIWRRDEVDTFLLRLHREISEASEAAREEKWKAFAEELADIAIYLLHLAELFDISLEKEIEKKMKKNWNRRYLVKHRRK